MVKLVDCAKECWEALERNKEDGLQISKNSVPASVPEMAIICGGLDPTGVMPSLLQLALTPEAKRMLREEIDQAIGEFNPNDEAVITARNAQDKSRIGHKGSALMGAENFKTLAEGLNDIWDGGEESLSVASKNALSPAVEYITQNPNTVLGVMEEGRQKYLEHMFGVLGMELGM